MKESIKNLRELNSQSEYCKKNALKNKRVILQKMNPCKQAIIAADLYHNITTQNPDKKPDENRQK